MPEAGRPHVSQIGFGAGEYHAVEARLACPAPFDRREWPKTAPGIDRGPFYGCDS
jgi:hypothetical protein